MIQSAGPQLVAIPEVAGKREEAAKQALQHAGFKVTVERRFDQTIPKGTVIGQSPDPGTKLEIDSTVRITVSRGPAPVVIPDVSGESAKKARDTLSGLGFQVIEQEEFSTDVPKGKLIGTDPPLGTQLPSGSAVSEMP